MVFRATPPLPMSSQRPARVARPGHPSPPGVTLHLRASHPARGMPHRPGGRVRLVRSGRGRVGNSMGLRGVLDRTSVEGNPVMAGHASFIFCVFFLILLVLFVFLLPYHRVLVTSWVDGLSRTSSFKTSSKHLSRTRVWHQSLPRSSTPLTRHARQASSARARPR